MRNVNLEKWRGKRDQVALDPTQLEFVALRNRSCAKCAFRDQWSEICGIANDEAKRRGLPICNDNVIYVLVEHDPRQLNMVEE